MSYCAFIHIIQWGILNYTVELYNWIQAGKNNNVALLDSPPCPHQLLVCICLLERAYFLECTYVYNDKLSLWIRTDVINRKHIVQPTGSALMPQPDSNTETKMSSFWRNFHHWLHWKLSFWQLPVQPVMNISSKWRLFRFSEWDVEDITPFVLCRRNYMILVQNSTVWVLIHKAWTQNFTNWRF